VDFVVGERVLVDEGVLVATLHSWEIILVIKFDGGREVWTLSVEVVDNTSETH
jgi:hypothetical protein